MPGRQITARIQVRTRVIPRGGTAVSGSANVFTDLIAEGDALDRIVAGLSAAQWELSTPAPGWTIRHQVAHLTSTVHAAGLAATNPDAFAKVLARGGPDFDAMIAALLAPYLAASPEDLLATWRSERDGAVRALAALAPDQMVPWVVRPIPARALASAGIMELFAHGQDIADTVGAAREYTDRIGHVAWFATRNVDFGYEARGLTPPGTEFRFELTAPSGTVWEFGPAGAQQRITGPAVDFCLLATRRRHRDDLAVRAAGAEADRWLDIAQAYRGSPGRGRMPGEFAGLTTA
jgi:enediyne biosynthesis protein E11